MYVRNYSKMHKNVTFRVLTVLIIKVTAFCDIPSCNVEADRMQYASLKRRSTTTRLHGRISQKAAIFIKVLLVKPERRTRLGDVGVYETN
jgi:hypothetical protein